MRKTYKIIILIVAFLSVSFASELSILYTHSVVGDDVKFDLTVAMVPDGGGAVETDSTNSVTLSLAGGSGNLTSATGLTQNLVNGQYTWNDLKYDATNDFTIQASATGVTNVTSETISGTTLETTFPYTENYDSFSSGITAGKLTDNWTNSMYEDDGDWTVDADGTPSNNTGPSYDHTQGSSGSGNYLFTESSNNQNPGNPNQSAYLESPVFDVSSLDIPVLQFWYHLYGGNMGYLHVDIFENGDWNNDVITAFTDNEDNWQAKAVNLSEYSDSIKVRFRGITGSGWRSDIAIDDFTIKESEDTVIVHQATTDSVTAGTDNNQILRLDFINTSNSYLDTLIITSNNTIDSDIKSNGVKLYYTSDSTFSTDEQIGIGKSFSGGEARFEDLNHSLSDDTSYVWVCYDISGSATLSDTVDAIIGANDIVVNSNSWSNEQQNPPKSRPVRTGKILESITYNQSKYRYADQGATGIPVLRVDIEVTGTSGIFNLNSLEVTSNNTNDADIQTNGVKLFRTSGTTFSTASQLGTSQSFSSGVATFSSLNYALNTGTTYIWVCYDINSGATIDNIIDAKIGIDDIDINGDTYPSAEESPNESMLVKDFVTVSPHKEGFETDFGDFNQYDFDDGSWTRISGGTPSNNTGPDGAYGGSYYVYTEASSGSDPGNPDQTTIIDLPLDLSSITDNFFYFYYHMYGASMGSLHIDVFDGEWHNDLFTKNGQQQTSDTDDWLKANISLRDYSNKNHVILRIRGITGDDYTSDMAVDNFTIMEREDTVIVHQATTDSVTAGTYNNQILRLDFINNPNLQDNVLDTLIVTSNNTTDIDIKSNGVKLYYTSDSTFSANDQIGSGKSFSGGEARFENLSYDLSSDTSFVWVCYDISDTATFDNTVDAIIGAGDVIVSGNSLLDNSQNPPNNRPIRTSKIIKSITYNQSEYRYADQGATEIPVLRIDLEVIGTSGTLKLNSLEVTSNNTNDADIQTNGVNLFTTSDSTFSTTNQLGTSQSFSLGVATFSSLDDTLDIGTTYIWVSYDINSGATIDNIIDAKIGINGIDINGDTYPSAEESPDESMLVKDFVTVSPHEEGFETDFGDFNQYDFDDGNWTRDNNGTPSNNTGPNGAYEGSYYVYTEASSGADPGFPDQTTIIDLPLDLSSITDNFFYFYYHMYGADMGSLRIDIFDGKWHNDLFMKSGQQQSADTDAWIKANVSLIDYNNKDHVILRIRGITGDGYTSDMAVDSIVIRESTEPPDVAINPSPADDSTRIDVRTDLSWDKNSTGGGVSGFKLSLWYVDGGNHYICQNKDLGGNVFTYDPSTDGYDTLRYNETYYWTVTPYNSNGSATGVSTWSFTTIDLVRILDYSESFEIGFNKWIQSSSDDGNWTRNSGGTPSGNTGPSGAHDGSYYLYTEASNGADPGFPNKTAIIDLGCDFTNYPSPVISFLFHMYGADMGSLHLDVYDTTWHEDVWSQNGQYQTSNADDWEKVEIELSDYTDSNYVTLRFRGITGTAYTSDMAIDSIGLFVLPPSPATNPDPQHLEIAVNQMKNLSWMPGVRSPNGYKISLWYVDGSNHYVCSDKDINNNLSYNPSDDGVDSLEYFTTYYWQVTPYSSVGDATSIPTWEFQTEAINDLSSYPTNSSNKSVDLFWNMSDKDTLKKIIYAKAFGDYPEYDDGTGSSPTIPTDTTTAIANSWTKIYSGSDTSYTHQTTERDYFYYASFIKYLQNDYCGEVESDSSLSYWLGDFNSDSSVLASDIAKLSVAFGTSDGDVDYVDSLDIGPTADSSRFALPLTDNVIDFEDLMIISMNYENTIYNNLIFDNNGMYQPMLYKNTYDDNNMIQIRMEASFNEDELVAKLYLKNNLGNLKGLKIPIKFSANLQVNHVTRGNIWEGTDFFIGKKSSNSIKIVGSAMGTDNAIHNNGEIATIYFDISGNHEMIDINFDEINTRSMENNEMKKEADIDLVPGVYFLSQNYPNPFNSSTQIKFAVREEGTVRINIYNIKGQLIKKLVNKEYRPNIYSVEWNAVNEFGKQVATGLYIYRIQINDYIKSKKMILLK